MYFGAGLYGAEKISQALFGKRARDLTLAEAALVAALIRAPSALSPWSNPEGALRRSQLVLATMREQGVIDAVAERAAVQTKLPLRPRPASKVEAEGYARDFLRQQFEESFGGDNRPDWQVHTTFVRPLQTMAERAVSAGLRQTARPGLQAALVALNPQTGDVLALVGGRDFKASPFDRATQGRRQAGSAFKPFVYAAALEHGWSPVSVLSGLTHLRVEGPDEWVPQNARTTRAAIDRPCGRRCSSRTTARRWRSSSKLAAVSFSIRRRPPGCAIFPTCRRSRWGWVSCRRSS